MAVSKLMIFLLISMAVVSTVRCLNDEYEGEEIVGQNNGPVDPSSGTPTDGKKGFKDCVKEKVKKVVDKGKELIKGAGDAISKGYNAIKDKIGKKQPDSLSPSTPVSENTPSSQSVPEYPPSGAFPQPPSGSSLPSGVLPGSSQGQGRDQSDITFSQSNPQDDVELLDPRQRFNRK